jgi:rhomboid-like protein
VGRGNFLLLYVTTGLFGSITSLTWYTMTKNFTTLSNGASGAMNGLLSAATLLINPLVFSWAPFKGEKVTIPVLDVEVPASAMILWPLLIGLELRSLRTNLGSNMDYLAHIGGYAAGTVSTVSFLWSHKIPQKKQDSADR